MFKHLLKIVWNRKRANMLITVELVVAFLVVFMIAGAAANFLYLYKQPLGFDYSDVYSVRISVGGEWQPRDGETLRSILSALDDDASVTWAHGLRVIPFENSRWTSNVRGLNDAEPITMANGMTDGAPQDLGIELTKGRWFDPRDNAMDGTATVINERLAAELFGDEDPLGRNIRPPSRTRPEPGPPLTVVGVFKDFRQMGEFSVMSNYRIDRYHIENAEENRIGAILVKSKAGISGDFEQRLIERFQNMAPTWSIVVEPLSRGRDRMHKQVFIPLSISGLVAGFMMLMVAFGLFGVLWQSVTQRTEELGMRRAMGAPANAIFKQIVMEMLILTGLAIILGSILAAQLPVLGILKRYDWLTVAGGIVISGVILLAIVAVCSIYPSWMAIRKQPADALRYE